MMMKEIIFASSLDEAGAIAVRRQRDGKSGAVIVRAGGKDLVSFFGETTGAVLVCPKDAALPDRAGDFRNLSEDGAARRLQLLYEAALIFYAGGGAASLLEAADRLRPCFTEAER